MNALMLKTDKESLQLIVDFFEMALPFIHSNKIAEM